jgi:hypothetical protein
MAKNFESVDHLISSSGVAWSIKETFLFWLEVIQILSSLSTVTVQRSSGEVYSLVILRLVSSDFRPSACCVNW